MHYHLASTGGILAEDVYGRSRLRGAGEQNETFVARAGHRIPRMRVVRRKKSKELSRLGVRGRAGSGDT